MRNASKIKKQIVGGAQAAAGQFPWQAAIIIDNSWLCGGSLILNNWVITAGHCTANRTSFSVRLGTVVYWAQFADSILVVTTTKYEHPNYDRVLLNNDVSLLKLPQSVTPSGKLNF